MESLWPKLEKLTIDLPINILNEQVDHFNSQMGGRLNCVLEKGVYSRHVMGASYDYTATLFISSPSLPGYRLQLIDVDYSVAKAYPCTVFNCMDDMPSFLGDTADDADKFKGILKKIFNSKDVINTLQNLIAQGM